MELNITPQMYFNYFERRESDLVKLRVSLERNRVEEFQRIGHQLLGNAATYGFYDLEKLARRIHEANQGRLHIEGPSLIRDFDKWITSTRADFLNRSGVGKTHAFV